MAIRVTIKDHIRENRLFTERAIIALAFAALGFLVITIRMVNLQVFSHEHFSTLSDNNRVSIVAVPPIRGLIYDRNGIVLAQNMPSFSLEIVPERIKDIDKTIKELGKLVQITDNDIERFREQLTRKRPFNSIPIRIRLNDEEVAHFATHRHLFPGVDIEARLIRDYPFGNLTAHTVGYVGRINESELQIIDESNYSATRHIGKTGIEKYYEDILHGTVGFNHIETNALGRTLRKLDRTQPVPGQNLYLTIDTKLQQIIENEMGNHRGAVVAINPKNGEVLALSSLPSYDPNPFVVGIDTKSYQALQESIDKPLFNRAIQGQYPPGSTLKPFIGLAGLELNKIDVDTSSFCPGWFMLKDDDHKYRDWKSQGHGNTNLNKAITESCDVFFYNLALTMGIDQIHHFLKEFGFGSRTGIDITGEVAGLLPSREWKRNKYQQPWYPGETLITGIGQGYTLSTPLQLATATAIFGNRGGYVQPRIVSAIQQSGNPEINTIKPFKTGITAQAKDSNWNHIIKAMTDVIHSIHGTARSIDKNTSYKIAGKTGTAQVFGIKQDEKYVKEDITARLRDHALFIAFAPADDPQIAVAVIVENGGSGGSVAAPIAGKVIDYYLSDHAP